MTEMEAQTAGEPTAGLTQLQRVVDTFVAPSKTFEDIRRGNKSWWMPLMFIVLFTYVLFAGITMKIGWAQVAENTISLNPKGAEKMAEMPEAQRETVMKFTTYSMEGAFAANPLLVVIAGVIATLVIWGTINFVFGGKATFPEMFAVWMYASLPVIIKAILGTIVIFSGMAPESFNLANYAPTSVGAFVNVQDVGPAIYRLATSLDFTTIWYLVLFSIGSAIVGKVKRSSGYTAVFGWWAIVVLFGVAVAAIRG